MLKRKYIVGAAIAAGVVIASAAAASAHIGIHAAGKSTGAAHGNGHGTGSSAVAVTNQPGAGIGTFFAADLNGANEVPVEGGPAVNDTNGRAKALVRIQGNQVCFTLAWTKIAAPTAGHIHAGAAGVNGAVKVAFFGAALPDSVRATTGCVTVDNAVSEAIVANAAGHYVNIHTGEFPGGAVRGQLRKLDRAVDLLKIFRGPKVALMDGAQEFPVLGDPDGRAVGFLDAKGRTVSYGVTWSGIGAPTNLHLHNAPFGAAGDIVGDLLAAKEGLPPTLSGVAGELTVDSKVVRDIRRNPDNFYFNLHNAEFPKGALRGQLFHP